MCYWWHCSLLIQNNSLGDKSGNSNFTNSYLKHFIRQKSNMNCVKTVNIRIFHLFFSTKYVFIKHLIYFNIEIKINFKQLKKNTLFYSYSINVTILQTVSRVGYSFEMPIWLWRIQKKVITCFLGCNLTVYKS